MRDINEVLKEQQRSRTVAAEALAQAAIAPASVDSRHTVRSARDPGNRYDPTDPDRDPRAVQGTVVPAGEPTPEQQAVLDTLNAAAAQRFRQQFGLRPLAV